MHNFIVKSETTPAILKSYSINPQQRSAGCVVLSIENGGSTITPLTVGDAFTQLGADLASTFVIVSAATAETA